VAAFKGETLLKETAPAPLISGDAKLRSRFRVNSKPLIKRTLGISLAIEQSLLERRFFHLLPYGLILGISAYRLAGAEPNVFATFALVLIVLIAVLLRTFRQTVPFTALLVFSVLVGFGLMTNHAKWFGASMLSYPIVVEKMEARVDERKAPTEKGVSVVVQLMDPTLAKNVERAKVFIRSKHLADNTIEVGDRISLRVRLAPIPKPVYPEGYDGQFNSFFKGIGATGSSLGDVRVEKIGYNSVFSFVDAIRWGIRERLFFHLKVEHAAIASALIIGDQSAIKDELRGTIANAGLAHVLAISGLHLTLVVGSAFLLFRVSVAALGMPDRYSKPFAVVAAMFVAVSYLLISGGGLATQRATLMLLLAFLAVLFGRRAITMRNVTIAALVVICLFPYEIFKASFQLSFAAVVGLVAVYEQINKSKFRLPTSLGFFAGLALTSLIAGAVTAPIAAVHFQQFAPFGLIGNLAAVPIVGFIVLPMAFFGVLLMPFGLENVPFHAMSIGIGMVVDIAKFVAGIGNGFSQTPVYSLWTLGALCSAMAWLTLFTGGLRFIGMLIVVPVFLVLGPADLPLLVVSDTTQGVIVRQADQFFQLGRKSNSFTMRAWGQRFGSAHNEGDAIGDCDMHGCVAFVDGRKIAVVKDSVAIHEDCSVADILIVRQRREVNCPNALVIYQRDLDKNGVATVFADEQGALLVKWTVNDHGRPWRPKKETR